MSLEAEESVLGAVLLSPRAIEAVLEEMRPEEFYRESHAKILRACVGLYNENRPVDAVTVIDALEQTGELGKVGGRGRIHELAAIVPATANAAHWARIVHETWVDRMLIRAGGEIARLGWERPDDAKQRVEQAEQIIFDLAGYGQTGGFVTPSEILRDTIANLERLYEAGEHVTGLASGWRDFDEYTAGFQPGNLIIVGARPSMGKTAYGLGLLAHCALRVGKPAALFTLEMSRAEVMQRLVAAEAFVDLHKLRSGRLARDEWDKIHRATPALNQAPIHVNDSGAVTLTEIRSHTRRLKLREPGLALVVIDYLQLMSGTGPQDNRVQELGQISRGLKLLARELDVPIVALSQLSRNLEQRHDKRPILADLRESGSLEQDADVVLFLYRDEYYHPEDVETAGIAEVNIAKQRNGPTGTPKLAFVKTQARFSDLAPDLPGIH